MVASPATTKYTQSVIIANVLNLEKGYVNNPDDSGGETNLGITKAKALEYKTILTTLYNWDGKMINLTKPMAVEVYTRAFWDKMNLSAVQAVCPTLADKLFNIGVNTGYVVAVQWLQRILSLLNLKEKLYPDLLDDGALGSKTISALKILIARRGYAAASWTLVRAMTYQQGAFYMNLTTKRHDDETFIYGWLDRSDANIYAYKTELGI